MLRVKVMSGELSWLRHNWLLILQGIIREVLGTTRHFRNKKGTRPS